ncbi:MAG: MarR family transcriptional regulator [Thermoprotei archaeon]|nr:MarR family transcriptional regulator [TACK group archaeon]
MEEKSTEALNYIKQNPGCKVSDVQRYLNVSRPVIATIIKSLEELGFVEKKQGKGRATALFVTQKGEEILAPKQEVPANPPPASIASPQPSPLAAAPSASVAATVSTAPAAQTGSPAPSQAESSPIITAQAPQSAQVDQDPAPQPQKKKGFFARLRALF